MAPDVPLVVDLDGTLIRTDLLLECFWKGMGTDPVRTVATSLRLLHDRPALKAALAEIAEPDISALPLDPVVAELIRGARADGREVALISGSTHRLVAHVAAEHGPFDRAEGSDRTTNLTRAAKAARLEKLYGDRGYDYVGDSAADIPVWQKARRAYVVRPTARLEARIAAAGVTAEPLGDVWTARGLASAFRPHQWLKNLLLLLPLIAAHRLDAEGLVAVLLGMVAFSALASSIYIVNDLTDLDADRVHETKRYRPFAAGVLPIKVGMAASLGLGVTGLVIGAFLGPWMLAVLLVYLAATLSYSMHLKRVRWVDVSMLAALYTLRVVAGAVAAGVVASGWLFGFIFPVFLGLGCVKRLTELARAPETGFLPGRRYQRADRADLLNVAIVAALCAVGVFVAYSLSDTAARLYDRVWALWAVAALLGAWLARMIWTGWTGRQDYDPIIFAITDRIGLAMILASTALLWFGAS
ncbi:UbiA family prenyltransferase [Halovulum dunhuangense]|uniref:UbiA family prenyltransferase n=2 Tax=Halovulum dunhuangense TaxID=1505036 RepID=A0A849L533_9RHOB|nr:UbiA family prenyltransferase [Halovulum dunhuangense]